MYASFFAELQKAIEGAKPEWAGVIEVEAPGGEWWHVATLGDLPTPVCEPGRWTRGADIVIRAPTDAAWTSLIGDPSALPAAAASGLVTTDTVDDGAAYAWGLWGGYILAWGGYTPVDVAAVSMEAEARGLSVELAAEGVAVAEAGTYPQCGARLTPALQAVQ